MTQKEEKKAQIVYGAWLKNFDKVGLKTMYKLLEIYKTPEDIYRVDDKTLLTAIHGVGGRKNIVLDDVKRQKEKITLVAKEVARIEKRGYKILSIYDENYPRKLKEIYGAPLNLYCIGEMDFSKFNVAIVGARHCSQYGDMIARKIAKELSTYNVNIISGMAYGIDIAAHEGALLSKGKTTAVLAGGVEVCYPKQHYKVYEEIKKTGMLISEEFPDVEPAPYMFPNRNRIISGLSEVVIIVEANKKSGSLITANFAIEQGREVYAVPGRVDSPRSEGTNDLLKQGANVFTQVEDITEYFTEILQNNEKILQKSNKTLEVYEKIVYSCISLVPIHIDDIRKEICRNAIKHIEMSRKAERELATILCKLELEQYIECISGNYYKRKQ